MAPTDENNTGSNVVEFTVSEISGALKRSVESQFGHVRVRAELSGVKRAASGHIYMALKDDKAVLDGICWRGTADKLSFRPEDGLEVICTGKLTTYPGRSKYQMVIERMEPAGAGALMALLEERKKKLDAEGLFDPARKKPIPFIPKVIGVVTSPTGAVIRDILHRLNERFPRQVIVWPVIVQGQGAAEQIAGAIRGFNAVPTEGGAIARPDVLIIARGGGSIEDLWAFNEEVVVRAASDSDIPLISAVGHETDTTLIDYVSDLRAPTPTGAAEKAVPVRDDLHYTIVDFERRLMGQKTRMISDRSEQLKGLVRGLPRPKDLMGLASQRLDDLSDRLPRGLKSVRSEKAMQLSRLTGGLSAGRLKQTIRISDDKLQSISSRITPAYTRSLEKLSNRLDATSRMLESLSVNSVLDRGYTFVVGADGKPVTAAAALSVGDHVNVKFKDGDVGVTVGDQALPVRTKLKKTAPKKPVKDTGQGSLL